jgi:undecaprenyl-diphosphatase
MDLILITKAIILGIIEGLTEFIPVSSTGHLIVFGEWLNFQNNDGHLFEIAIQLGAILAICFLYREKLFGILQTCHKNNQSQGFICKVFIAFIPSVIFGILFYNLIKTVFFSPIVVAISLIIGGLIILYIENLKLNPSYNNIEKISMKSALKIGFYQTLSIIPGVSRSGATIIGGILSKLNRKTATEFSFFLAIPTIAGATFYDIYKNWNYITDESLNVILIGFLVSFISSIFVIKWLIGFVSHNNLKVFGWYRIVLGIIILSINWFY